MSGVHVGAVLLALGLLLQCVAAGGEGRRHSCACATQLAAAPSMVAVVAGRTVVRNATGILWQQQVPLNLTALLPGVPGWHKLTVQGKAVDADTSAVQTGEHGWGRGWPV